MNGYQIATLIFLFILVAVLFMDYRENKMFNDYIRAKSGCSCKDKAPAGTPATTPGDAPLQDALTPAML